MMNQKLDTPIYESILGHIGGFGRYQIVLLVWFQTGLWVVVANMGFMVFGGLKPADCHTRNSNASILFINTSKYSGEQLEHVHDCKDVKFYSLVYEWNLVDDLNYASSLITSMQMIGVLIGTIVGGQLSDRFGRKYTFLSFYMLLVGSALGSALCTSWIAYCAVRTVIGVGLGAVIPVQYILTQESLSSKWRLITVIGYWPLGFIVLGVLALLTNHWRWLSIVIGCIGFIPLFLTIFIHESPKWLIETRRYDRALKVLKSIAKTNRKCAREEEFNSMADLNAAVNEDANVQTTNEKTVRIRKTYTYWHLYTLHNTAKRLQFGVLFLSWFTVSMLFYGILFNMGALSGHPAINTIIFGLLRLIISTPLPFIDRYTTRFGRKMLHTLGLISFWFCLLALTVIFHTGYHETYPILINIFSLIGLTASTFIWSACEVYTCELFPTVLRNMGNASANVFARIGTVLAPQTLLLPSYHFYTLYICLLSVNTVCAWFILPETKGKPLPEICDPNEVKEENV